VTGLLTLLLGAFPDFWLKRFATDHADDAVIVECKFGGAHRGTWAESQDLSVDPFTLLPLDARGDELFPGD